MISEFARFKNRRGSSTQWYFIDEVLMDGEIGIERDSVSGNDRVKIGDGVTPWNLLKYIGFDDAASAQNHDILQKQAVVQAAAGVVDSDPRLPTLDQKLALDGSYGSPGTTNPYVTTSDPRVPTLDEKAALAGTGGAPSSLNKYVTDDDERVPTQGENDALAGTSGTPSSSNKYVTDDDTRVPTQEENDALVGTSGTPGSSNKYVTDYDTRVPTQGENDALAGTSGTPSSSNKYVTNDDTRVPTQEENDALAGTSGTAPSGSNKLVDNADTRMTNARTPTSHASTHNAGGGDALAADQDAATASLRTLGTSATSACAGNDSRLSDARTPTSHASTHNAGGGDAMTVDAAAGTGSLRTLGTGSTNAAAGNDARFPTSEQKDALAGTSGTPSSSNKYVTNDDERLIVSGLLPTGAVTPFAGSVAPSGFLICDGSAVSRAGQADLFTVIGTTYGAGDGSTTFNIPDLRGKVPIGVSGSHALASTGGEETHTLTVDEIPAHTHTYKKPANLVAAQSANIGCGPHDSETGSTGGDQPHNNMPPYLTLNYIIKT